MNMDMGFSGRCISRLLSLRIPLSCISYLAYLILFAYLFVTAARYTNFLRDGFLVFWELVS